MFAVGVVHRRNRSPRRIVDDGHQAHRALTLSGPPFICCGQLVKVGQLVKNSDTGFRYELIKIMGTEATERGHFRKLQVMVFGGVADFILCRLADASGHHAHLVSVGHVRPLARNGGGVGLSVCAFSFSPGDLQTFAHQDFRHLAPHVSRRRFADGPCPRHGLAHVVSLFHCSFSFKLIYFVAIGKRWSLPPEEDTPGQRPQRPPSLTVYILS